MRRIRMTILSLLVVALMTAACAANGNETKTIGASDAGKTISLTVGDTLEMTLEGNPTTGFNWAADSLDTSILKQVGDPAFTPSSTAIGAGGQVVLNFEAVGSGGTTLHLIYHRSWETGVAPEKTFDVTVQVGQ